MRSMEIPPSVTYTTKAWIKPPSPRAAHWGAGEKRKRISTTLEKLDRVNPYQNGMCLLTKVRQVFAHSVEVLSRVPELLQQNHLDIPTA